MPRPFKCRRVCGTPGADYFKPRGIPLSELQEIGLTIDEFEAIRLADLEGLYQEDAARKMDISRQTFGNIIASAHKKIADALVSGKALKIEGNNGIKGTKHVKKYSVLSSLKKKTQQLKQYGYDLAASREFIWKVSGIRHGQVLEIGTGKGHLTALLSQKGLQVISVDLDGEVLKTAKAHLSALKLSRHASLRKMNAEKLLFKSENFDNVISVDFFHHAKNPLRCLREMMRVARKTLTIADLNQHGMQIMDLVHKSEGKKHETSKISFRDLKKQLLAHHFNVKSYRHPCHQIFVAQRRNS